MPPAPPCPPQPGAGDGSAPVLAWRAADAADVPFLLQLRHDAMDPHLRAAGAQVDAETARERLLYRFDCAHVLLVQGQPGGMIKLLRGTTLWEIVQLQIAPAHQGRGIGQRLLEALAHQADAAGAMLSLGVLRNNPALRLYQRLGFAITAADGLEYRMQRPPAPAHGSDTL